MAIETRAQGRPPRGDGEFGRARLLDRTRNALEGRPKLDILRSEIALSAGVTPALVSYYYRDKWDLFAAAAEPVVTAYTTDVRRILHRSVPLSLKARLLVKLFINFNIDHGYLLDFCLTNSEKMDNSLFFKDLRTVNIEIRGFFKKMLKKNLIKGDDVKFTQASLWGLCKYVAQQSLIENAKKISSEERTLLLTEHVYNLFFREAATFESNEDGKAGASAR